MDPSLEPRFKSFGVCVQLRRGTFINSLKGLERWTNVNNFRLTVGKCSWAHHYHLVELTDIILKEWYLERAESQM